MNFKKRGKCGEACLILTHLFRQHFLLLCWGLLFEVLVGPRVHDLDPQCQYGAEQGATIQMGDTSSCRLPANPPM